MACFLCRHFQGEGDYLDRFGNVQPAYSPQDKPGFNPKAIFEIERIRLMTGQCSFNPVWVPVSGAHFCAQFAPNFSADAAAVRDWCGNIEAHERYKKERDRRIALQKKRKQNGKQSADRA
jgi:hypothetical protein